MTECEEINGKIDTKLLILTLLLEMVKMEESWERWSISTSIHHWVVTISTYYFYDF